MILANAHVVTMDDGGSEHEQGWLRIEDGRIAALGAGEPPEPGEDLGGAVVTPGLVNTHHHLYQTLTRARAQQANLFEWLRELYPVWAGIDDEMEYAAARTGLAELALSGCTTVFDHHYLFPPGREGLLEAEIRAARELGLRVPHDLSVLGWDDSPSARGSDPALTTVGQSLHDQGRTCARLLVAATRGETAADDLVHLAPWRLVTRESTGSPAPD